MQAGRLRFLFVRNRNSALHDGQTAGGPEKLFSQNAPLSSELAREIPKEAGGIVRFGEAEK